MTLKRIYSHLPAITVLLFVAAFLYQKPYYNWDMFPYMALAVSDPSIPFDTTQAYVNNEVVNHMPPQDLMAISQRQPQLMRNPLAFKEALKYFDIKPAYILTVRFFHLLGFNLVASTYLPSILSYFFIGVLLLFWLQDKFKIQWASIITLAVLALPFLFTTARYSSPDMLCAAITLAGIFLILRSKLIPGLGLCLLAVFVRPDTIIFNFFLMIVLFQNGRVSAWMMSTFLVLNVSCTLLTLGGIGLLKEFPYTAHDYSPAWTAREMTRNYGASLWIGLESMFKSFILIALALGVAVVGVSRRIESRVQPDLWPYLSIAAISTFIFRYLLHPVVEDRFLISCYLVILLGFVFRIGDLIAARK